MKISFQDYEILTVLTISGDLTAEDVEQFSRVVDERIHAGAKHILIDCENMEFIDSAGLEAWLRVQERLGSAGGQFRLVRPDETLATILSLTRLDLAFESLPTVEAAVRSLR